MRKPLLLVLLLSSCTVETEEELADEDLGEVEQHYQQSQVLAVPFGATVQLNYTYQNLWTGTVLSDHWILTSAHACAASTNPIMTIGATVNGAEMTVYSGEWTCFRHPSWQSGASYDLGLIYLKERGISFVKRAKVYSGATSFWTSGTQQASWMEGYGAGPTNCSDGLGILKGLSKFTNGGSSTDAYFKPYLSCDGDSGGPWGWKVWNGSAWDLVQYAVNHGKSNWYPDGYRSLAAVIRPGLSWIQSQMSYTAFPLTAGVSTGSLGGYEYKTYSEQTASGRLVAPGTNLCLDANGAVDGTPVLAQPCDSNSLTQRWTLWPQGDLRPYWYSYLCLRAPGLIHDNGLHLQYCSRSDEQLFRYDRYTDELHSAAVYGLCADRPAPYAGTHVLMRNCTRGASQVWDWTL